MTLADNETLIKNEVTSRKTELLNVLKNCVDRKTNDYFSKNSSLNSLSLTELCIQAKDIQSIVDNTATIPTAPTIIDPQNLYDYAYNIHNKIQYCNNLLRYTLRKNGINFNNSNIMEDLIQYIGQIESVRIYDEYISDIELDDDGNLLVSSITVDQLNNINIINSISSSNGDIILSYDNINNMNYEDAFIKIILDSNDNIYYEQIKDME